MEKASDDMDRDELYLRSRKALIDFAASLVGSRSDAEDIVQDAYLQFLPHASGEKLPAKSYLFRIVRNLSFNRYKRRKMETSLSAGDIPWWALPSAAATPEDTVLLNESIRCIMEAIHALPEQARCVLYMYRFDGMTLQEIATTLDLSLSKTHRLLNEAARAIKENMPRDS